MSIKKLLPLSLSTFSEVIEKNCVYVDKTQYIYDLYVKAAKYYFLSRPRRFGKSLLISTLKQLFSGNRELFKACPEQDRSGLWIEKSDWIWKKHPVIHLDFSMIDHDTATELKIDLCDTLDQIAKEHKHDLGEYKTPGTKLKSLVKHLAKQEKVVILIDEYDKPLIDHISDPAAAEKNRKALRGFYDVIKGLDEYLRAVFITGVSKFSKVSIFSGINNLNDISDKPIAAGLLGYTQPELELYFASYLEDAAQAQNKSIGQVLDDVKAWYNGYRFSEVDLCVYNPFSVLNFLNDKRIRNYWATSGTPGFLIDLLKKNYHKIPDLTDASMRPDSMGPFETDRIPLIPLLYQAGYLTVEDTYLLNNKVVFKLNHPNEEIREAFSTCIIAALTHAYSDVIETTMNTIYKAFTENNIAILCKELQILFADIPYQLHIKHESYYHSLFQAIMHAMGFNVQSEVNMSNGRIDMVLEMQQRIFVIEIKFNKTTKEALQQLIDRQYHQKYINYNKPITLVGIVFKRTAKKPLDIVYDKQDL